MAIGEVAATFTFSAERAAQAAAEAGETCRPCRPVSTAPRSG